MEWSDVGNWLKSNAGAGVSLIGSLVTGNIPGAIASGVSMISSATGTDDPEKSLSILQGDPGALVKLKELYYKEEDSIRLHLQEMTRLQLEDAQKEQHETQETIRAGDSSTDRVIRLVRPTHATISLGAAIYYALCTTVPSVDILGVLLILPFTYAGLRGWDKFNELKSISK